ncbi:hypothetical protein F4677DRAFT_89020 [Hypoxylon crocopeplum]|nr:hypothetical protein F4677DRAFT_89020 [Hypoxylon crocopeplum]
MDRVVCSCLKCAHRLGEFVNLWIKIGKSYISPVVNSEDSLSVAPTGSVRLGDEKTLIDSCHVQDVACSKCRAVIGLKCLDTPVNHVLHQDQLFLRLSSVVITTLDGHFRAEVTIQRTLKLREASRNGSTTTNTPPASETSAHMFTNDNGSSEIHGQLLDHIQAQLNAQMEETQRLNRAGYQMVSSFDNAVLRIEGEVKKLKDSMTDLREESRNYHSKDVGMENAITSLKDELEDVKNASQDQSTYGRLEQELASAKQAIVDVRQSLANELENSAKRHQQKHKSILSDLEHTQDDLGRVQTELNGTRETMKESVVTAKAYAKEVASLRVELKELREEMARERSERSPNDPVFPAQEIDILTTNITKIGQRASQVETLQMEFELLKGRVQRMEKARTPNSQDATDVGTQHRNLAHSLPRALGRKRKHSPQPEVAAKLDTPSGTSSSKRPTRTPSSGSPSKNKDSMGSPPSSKAQKINTKASDSPWLTKSGTIDKRFLRGSRPTAGQDRSPNG